MNIINARIVDQRYCDFHVPLKMRVLCIRSIDVILYKQGAVHKVCHAIFDDFRPPSPCHKLSQILDPLKVCHTSERKLNK